MTGNLDLKICCSIEHFLNASVDRDCFFGKVRSSSNTWRKECLIIFSRLQILLCRLNRFNCVSKLCSDYFSLASIALSPGWIRRPNQVWGDFHAASIDIVLGCTSSRWALSSTTGEVAEIVKNVRLARTCFPPRFSLGWGLDKSSRFGADT